MAVIIENVSGRRSIRLSTNDVISIVREYQNLSSDIENYEKLRLVLDKFEMYVPEDLS